MLTNFNAANPYLFDRATILRYSTTGSEDGTPVVEPVVVATGVPCRMDTIVSRRRDQETRARQQTLHENQGICFFPPETDLKPDDLIQFPAYDNELWEIHDIDRAYGGTGIHHLEVNCYRAKGAI